jgi:hypothetical protein
MNSIHRRRAIAAVAGVALAAGAVVACTHRWPPKPRTTTSTVTITWPGSWTPPTTTTDTAPGTTDCGTAGPWGGPTTTLYPPPSGLRSGDVDLTQGPGRCLVDAWAAGTPARLVTRSMAPAGAEEPGVALVWDVLGPGRLRVTRQDTRTDPPTTVAQYECRLLTTTSTRLVPGGCQPLPPAAPPFDGRACGSLNYGAGWPSTFYTSVEVPGPGSCFLDAWAAGTPARLVTSVPTSGYGDRPVVTTYDVLGTGQLRVITDHRLAGGTDVTVEHCTSLTHDHLLHPADCTPG